MTGIRRVLYTQVPVRYARMHLAIGAVAPIQTRVEQGGGQAEHDLPTMDYIANKI